MLLDSTTPDAPNPVYECVVSLLDYRSKQDAHLMHEKRCRMYACSYLKEYNTIKVSSFREAGHSNAIERLVTNVFERSLVIYPNQRMLQRSMSNVTEKMMAAKASELFTESQMKYVDFGRLQEDLEADSPAVRMTSDQFIRYSQNDYEDTPIRLRGVCLRDVEAIIVDCAQQITRKQRDSIYNGVATHCRASDQVDIGRVENGKKYTEMPMVIWLE